MLSITYLPSNIQTNLNSLSTGNPFQTQDLLGLLSSMLGWLLLLAAVFVFICILVSGVQWITGGMGGSTSSIEDARNRLTACIIGFAVLATSYAIAVLVQYFLGISVIQMPGSNFNPGSGVPAPGPGPNPGGCNPACTGTLQCLNGTCVTFENVLCNTFCTTERGDESGSCSIACTGDTTDYGNASCSPAKCCCKNPTTPLPTPVPCPFNGQIGTACTQNCQCISNYCDGNNNSCNVPQGTGHPQVNLRILNETESSPKQYTFNYSPVTYTLEYYTHISQECDIDGQRVPPNAINMKTYTNQTAGRLITLTCFNTEGSTTANITVSINPGGPTPTPGAPILPTPTPAVIIPTVTPGGGPTNTPTPSPTTVPTSTPTTVPGNVSITSFSLAAIGGYTGTATMGGNLNYIFNPTANAVFDLSWQVSNATGCLIQSVGSINPTSGTQRFTLTPANNTRTNYTLFCTGSGGTTSQANILVYQGTIAPPVIVDFYLENLGGTRLTTPYTLAVSTFYRIKWLTTGANTCTLDGTQVAPASGLFPKTLNTPQATHVLTCASTAGTEVTQTITIN